MGFRRHARSVVVVGAGLSGIATAQGAAMQGLSVPGALCWTTVPGLADHHNQAPGAQPAGRYLTNEVIQ